MASAQGVARAIVIEGRAVDRLERRRRVAAVAARAELAAMRIGMAGGALTVLDWAIPGEWRSKPRARMAVRAHDRGMRASQRIRSPGVIESRRGFPVLDVVTLETVPVERATVYVLVAGGAPHLESYPANIWRLLLRETRPRGHAEAGLARVPPPLARPASPERPAATRLTG